MISPKKANWFSADGEPIKLSEIYQKIINSGSCTEIHVGTDSDPGGKRIAFVTGIVIRYPGNGANYFWSRSYIPATDFFGLGHRLETEIADSLIVAELLRLNTGREKITIHADCSVDPKHASSQYAQRITSYAKGMGYVPLLKPDSWAASSVADKHAKAI